MEYWERVKTFCPAANEAKKYPRRADLKKIQSRRPGACPLRGKNAKKPLSE